MTLGQKLMKLRKSSGMSQEDLAGKMLVSRQAISRWESGETMPDSDNLLRLSEIFQVSADYLLHDEYEGDRDIPAVKTAEEVMTKQQKLNICFLLAVGGGAVSMMAGFFVWIYYETPYSILIGCIGYMAAIMYFKTNMFKYAAEDQIWRWKRKLIRTFIWFLGAFPGVVMIQDLVETCSLGAGLSAAVGIAVYLAVCGGVTLALWERK